MSSTEFPESSESSAAFRVEFSTENFWDPTAVRAALANVKEGRVGDKEVNSVFIRCLPKRLGGAAWHEGGKNPNENLHVTVEYAYIDHETGRAKHISTHHVNPEGIQIKSAHSSRRRESASRRHEPAPRRHESIARNHPSRHERHSSRALPARASEREWGQGGSRREREGRVRPRDDEPGARNARSEDSLPAISASGGANEERGNPGEPGSARRYARAANISGQSADDGENSDPPPVASPWGDAASAGSRGGEPVRPYSGACMVLKHGSRSLVAPPPGRSVVRKMDGYGPAHPSSLRYESRSPAGPEDEAKGPLCRGPWSFH